MAMMAMTTNNSIKVNAGNCRLAANGKERGDFWLFIGSMLNVYRMPIIFVKSIKKKTGCTRIQASGLPVWLITAYNSPKHSAVGKDLTGELSHNLHEVTSRLAGGCGRAEL